MPQDISELIRAEGGLEINEFEGIAEKLKRSESLLAEAQQIAHIGSWNWDLQSGAFEWSDEHYRIFGLEPQRPPITLERAWGLVHPDDRERVKQIVARSIENGHHYECILRVLHDDGTVRTAQSRGEVSVDEKGTPARISGTIQDITDRTEVEGKLRRSEALLAEAQRVAQLGSWSRNLHSGELVWSDECYRIFGLPPQESPMTFELFLSLLHPDDRERVRTIVDQALRDRQPYDCSMRVLRRDGTERNVYVRGNVASDASAGPARTFGTVQDLTERKGVEKALRRSEWRLQQAADLVGLCNYEWDFTNGQPIWGARLKKIWGLPPDALIDREAILSAIHPEDRSAVETAVARARDPDGDGRYAAEYRVIGIQDGIERWVAARGCTFFDDGKPVEYLGAAMEITERKEAEGALRESEAHVRLLLDSTAEAIYGLDLDGKCTFCNPACLRLLGYRDSADLLGKPMHSLIHHTRRDGAPYPIESCPVLRAFLRGEDVHADHEVLWRADGSSFAAEYWSHSVRRGGQVVGAVVTFLDITDRERLETEILEATERERQRIGQDLHDDLCQQLTGIAFTTRLLQQRLMRRTPAAAAVAEEIVQGVQQATVRARELAKGLHPVRLEADGLPAALRELAANVETVFRIPCRFRCRGAREAARVAEPAVAIQLYRIAQEAATNSVKHGKAKSIFIHLRMVKGQLKLSIADDGVGIAEDRPRIGMGLPIMSRRARVIGAALTVARRGREGTLVTCSLGGAAIARRSALGRRGSCHG